MPLIRKEDFSPTHLEFWFNYFFDQSTFTDDFTGIYGLSCLAHMLDQTELDTGDTEESKINNS